MANLSEDASGNIIHLNADTGKSSVYNPGDIAFVLVGTFLIWLMAPGVAFFYSGLLRRKNALSMIYLGMATLAVVSIQWMLFGFSLAFSETSSSFIGNFRHAGMIGVLDGPSVASASVPSLVYFSYQLMFAAFTAMLAVGAFAERGRLGPVMVWVFLWVTFVYCPIASWTWNPRGWSHKLNVYDSAGGTPVHIASGAAALAVSIYLGPRVGYGTERLLYRPQNTSYVVLGTILMWYGWFGFNGAALLSANLRAANAVVVTNLAASTGGITWLLWEWRAGRQWSAIGFCSGAIAGMVAITPGSGYVGPPASLAFGVAAGTICSFATQLKYIFGFDDCLDIFSSHFIGGLIGNILTGIFAQKRIAALDGVSVIAGGWIDHHWKQVGLQLANSTAGLGWSFVVTTIICWAMHFIPGLRLRASEEEEERGIDEVDMGEVAYDYIDQDDSSDTRMQPSPIRISIPHSGEVMEMQQHRSHGVAAAGNEWEESPPTAGGHLYPPHSTRSASLRSACTTVD